MNKHSAQTVTLLCSDIESSTRLWEQHSELMQDAVAHHDTLLKDTITRHGGRILKTTGDGVLAAFDDAAAALLAAIDSQLDLQQQSWEGMGSLKMRIGIHSGPISSQAEHHPTIWRTTGIMDLAHGGQVVVSSTTHVAVQNQLPEQVDLKDLGQHRLKDLTQTEQVYQLVHPKLDQDFPALRSLGNLLNNLPPQRDLFVGRTKELEDLKKLLSETQLLTLMGMGGTGKTRLSLQLAVEQIEDYGDGVWFVTLAPLADPELVTQTVAYALGVKESAGQPLIDTLCKALKPKDLLLVLDNCEHVVKACAVLADRLLSVCERVYILATSREGLGVSGEVRFVLNPLPVPEGKADPLVELEQSEAAQLFVERAKTVRPLFQVSEQNAPHIVEICRQLDGIPLALELAAARLGTMSVAKLADQLGARFELLRGGHRTALPHQQTLESLIDWSYELLEEPEQVLLNRLAVFRGFSLEAAEDVCAGDGLDELDVLDYLEGLINKSLVVVQPQADGKLRNGLLESVKQYAWQKLEGAGEVGVLRQRHGEHFLRLAEEAKQSYSGAEVALWLTRMEVEHDNLRASIQWALDTDKVEEALRLGVALGQFWHVHGHYSEGIGWLKQMLQRPAKASLRAGALLQAGNLTLYYEGPKAAKPFLEESLALCRELKDRKGEADVLNPLGQLAFRLKDVEAAIALFGQSHTIYRELGDKEGIALMLNNLGLMRCRQGNYEQAEALLEESLAVSREHNRLYSIAIALNNLGLVRYRQGDHQGAQALHEESLLLRRELGHRRGFAVSFNSLAADVGAQGEPWRAAQLLGAAQALLEEIGADLEPEDKALHQETAENARQALGEAGYREAFAQGQDLTLEQTIDLALQPPANEET